MERNTLSLRYIAIFLACAFALPASAFALELDVEIPKVIDIELEVLAEPDEEPPQEPPQEQVKETRPEALFEPMNADAGAAQDGDHAQNHKDEEEIEEEENEEGTPIYDNEQSPDDSEGEADTDPASPATEEQQEPLEQPEAKVIGSMYQPIDRGSSENPYSRDDMDGPHSLIIGTIGVVAGLLGTRYVAKELGILG